MKKLGEYLVEKGVLTREQLNLALETQKSTKDKLGNILVKLGFISDKELYKVLAEQYNLSVFEEEGIVLTVDTQRKFPKNLIEKYNVIPVKYTEKGFYVGISNISSLNDIPDIAFALGKNVIPVLFTDALHEKIISDLMHHSYGETDYFLETFESFLKKRFKGEMSLEKLVQTILAFDKGIQQIIFSENSPPTVKKIGHFYKLSLKNLNRNHILSFIKELTDDNDRKKIVNKGYVNFRKPIGENYYNITVIKHKSHFTISLKLIRTTVTSLDSLGFEHNVLKILKNPLRGLYLFIAPFGHGKSMVKSSLLSYYNKEKRKNILSIEKNIDYDIKSDSSLVTQYEVGSNMEEYASYVSLAYEIDPDVLMVSHIPDSETLEKLLDFSESGRPVFVTFESGSISGALEKLFSFVDSNKKNYLLGKFTNQLQIIINFKMIPVLGIQRKILIYEYILNSNKLKKMIKDQTFDYIDTQLKGVQDFIPIEKKLADLFNKGTVDLETCENYADNLDNFHKYVQR